MYVYLYYGSVKVCGWQKLLAGPFLAECAQVQLSGRATVRYKKLPAFDFSRLEGELRDREFICDLIVLIEH